MTDAVRPDVSAVPIQEERRKSLRYALRVEGTAWSVARVAAEPFAVIATDISRIGMRLHSAAEVLARFESGDELLLGFPHPDPDSQVRLAATLVWKRRGLMNLFGEWSFGVIFHDTPEAEIRRLLDPAARNATPLPEA
jgi:hypothetical protein